MSIVNTKFPASPTVVKRTLDFSSIVRNSLNFSGAYVGAYPWGPACEYVDVFDVNDQTSKFGKPEEWNYLHHFAVSDYLAYSSPMKVMRVIDDETYNAYSGNRGTGFTGSAQVVNGELIGVTFITAGSRYVIGDIVAFETTHDVIVQAVFEVTSVDSSGAVLTMDALENGKGYVQGDALSVADIRVQIKNEDDFRVFSEVGCEGILQTTTALNTYFPTVIAKYPGSYGNSISFSVARASEFENWEYKDVFAVAPSADSVSYEIGEFQNEIDVPASLLADWDTDWVVTVNGIEYQEGTIPNTYQLDTLNSKIIINIDNESFVGDDATDTFALANLFAIPTQNVSVTVNGTEYPKYTGLDTVPFGYVRVNGNEVTFGTNLRSVSGDSINTDFQMSFGTDTIDLADLQVTADGIQKTVVTVGPVAAGEVLATTGVVGTDNILYVSFFAGEEPLNGSNNIIARTGFLAATDAIDVNYDYPEAGELTIFSNQTEIHAVVTDVDGVFGSGEANEVLEAYSFLSLTQGTKDYNGSLTYYKDAINKKSSFVWISGDILSYTTIVLAGGTDSVGVSNAELIEGWKYFVDPDEVSFNYLVGGAADVELSNWIINNVLECRCDVLGMFSPEFDDVVCNARNVIDNVVDWRGQINSSSFAITEGNWKLRYDEFNDVYRWIPLSQDTAGIIARSHQENGPWVSPAGTEKGQYKNVVRLAYNPTRQQRDILYPNDVNPVYNAKNIGPVLYGDKTLIGRNSSFSQIGVRSLFIKVQNDIAEFSKDFLFQLNDSFTRNRFKNTIAPYMRNLLGEGAMDDFRIVVDETNNTADVINNQFMCATILIRPNYSINFICLDFVNTRFGLEFEELIDSQRIQSLI